MSAHPAPAGVFELQRTDSLTQSRATGSNYVVEDDAATDSDVENQLQEQSDFEDDEDIEDSVKEDMKKLEDSFPGISDRFRLVNRIGEGTVSAPFLCASDLYIKSKRKKERERDKSSWLTFGNLQVHSRRCTKQKIFYTTTISTIGICFKTTRTIPGKVHRRNGAALRATMGKADHRQSREGNHDMLH